jgi:hypothetical protein
MRVADIVNLIKLCVGAERVEDLIAWQRARFGADPAEHITRMWPKRSSEVLAGGSLYWVFKGEVLARQPIIGLQERRGTDGILRCALVLAPDVIRTEPMPRRPFQGWRYLAAADAPRDLPQGRAHEEPLPDALQSALAQIGLR